MLVTLLSTEDKRPKKMLSDFGVPSDRVPMVARQNAESLTQDQQRTVVSLARGQIGNQTDSRQFSAAATLLLANIARFETIPQKQLTEAGVG